MIKKKFKIKTGRLQIEIFLITAFRSAYKYTNYIQTYNQWKVKNIIKDLEKLVKQYIDLTISDIRVEASEMFDKNFQREAFFNEKWARRKIQ